MNAPSLGLLVLRASDVAATVGFYSALGLRFTEERHGKGPLHFSCVLGETVVEIYPAAESRGHDGRAAGATMIGFRVESLDQALKAAGVVEAAIITKPAVTAWGRRAVICDPDGRAVELLETPALRSAAGN